jgi:hypothetical protein
LPRNRGQLGWGGAPARVERERGTVAALDWGDGLQGKCRDLGLVHGILEKSVRVGIPCVLIGPASVVRVHLIVRFDGTDDKRSCDDSGGKGTTHIFESKKIIRRGKEGERYEEKRE